MKLLTKSRWLKELETEKEIEKEFWTQEYTMILSYFKVIVLLSSILFLLFAIPDYIYVYGNTILFYRSLVLRGIMALVILTLFVRMSNKHINYKSLQLWITFTEMVCTIIYFLIIKLNGQPNLLIKSFDIIVLILTYSLIPNRWIYNTISSSLAFIVLVLYSYSGNNNFNPGIVYVFIIMVLILFITFVYDKFRRENFLFKKKLTELKNTDYLTGIYNRVKFEEECKKLLEKDEKDVVSFTLIFFDIDNFKNINDTYGHLYGDKMLIQLVDVIKSTIRSSDIFARWGGDEFFLLLPDTSKEQAIELSKRMEDNLYKKCKNYGHALTCSFGIIQYQHRESMYEFIKRADTLMYQAKHEGKNSIRFEQ